MQKLFDDDDQDSDIELKTNTDYATGYNTWRRKEELSRLKTKYGDIPINDDDYNNEDESSSSDEDENGVQLTEEFEKDFFKTLAYLKKKDPRIYDRSTQFFNDDPASKDKHPQKIEDQKEKKKDPLLLKNYEKKMLIKTGGKYEEDEESDEEQDARSYSPTYAEEQRKLKESLKNALEDHDNEENNWGGMFQKREKTIEENQKEDDEYSQWLRGQKNELIDKNIENELEPLKDYWSNPKLDKGEAFLRDYLLNKKYLENQDNNYIPTYEEIVHDSDEGLSEDEKNIDNQEEFETKYNHRFEEPDEEYIKRYPRTMANTVRKTDDRRKLKRVEVKQRKEEEKKQKQEELKQLKTYKRKEIEDKIKKLKEITGNDDLAFQDDDIEEDFDPEAYDRRMQEIFSNDYYGVEEGDQKPEFSNLEDELGPWAYDNQPHCEDENFIMDCEYDPNAASTSKDNSKKRRNRFDKKGNKIEESEFNEDDKRYEKYTDELYKLDYEDMIGDIPCRFKYRDVLPNNFGLSIEEILIAKDRELNRWCSLKKATQHRPDHVERYEFMAYRKKAENEALKRKILSSLYEELEEPTEDEFMKLNKDKMKNEENSEEITEKGRKEQHNKKVVEKKKHEENINMEDENLTNINEPKNKKERKNKRKKTISASKNEETNVTESEHIVEDVKTDESPVVVPSNDTKNKKKKRKSSKTNNIVSDLEDAEVKVDENSSSSLADQNKIMENEHETLQITENQKSSMHESEENENGKLTRRQRKNKKKLQQKANAEKKEGVDNNTSNKKEKRKRKNSEQPTNDQSPKKKFKPNKNTKPKINKEEVNISDSRLQAYGLNPKKFKNKLKYKKQ